MVGHLRSAFNAMQLYGVSIYAEVKRSQSISRPSCPWISHVTLRWQLSSVRLTFEEIQLVRVVERFAEGICTCKGFVERDFFE
jgi:hypothetical protein